VRARSARACGASRVKEKANKTETAARTAAPSASANLFERWSARAQSRARARRAPKIKRRALCLWPSRLCPTAVPGGRHAAVCIRAIVLAMAVAPHLSRGGGGGGGVDTGEGPCSVRRVQCRQPAKTFFGSRDGFVMGDIYTRANRGAPPRSHLFLTQPRSRPQHLPLKRAAKRTVS